MDNKPIFIVGCPRSGTTLLRVILDSHPNICSGPETHLIVPINNLYNYTTKNWMLLEPFGLKKEEFERKISEVLSVFTENYTTLKNKKRWAEKTPNNIFYLDFIYKIFPNCQIINIIRDGRDVVTSLKNRRGFTVEPYIIRKWNQSIRLTLKYRELFDKNTYYEVRYEDLVTNPEVELKKIMRFLQEEWTPVLLNHNKVEHDYWFKDKKISKNDSKIGKNINRHSPSRPIFNQSIGKWK